MEEKKTNKVKEFVEKHKKALIGAGVVAVGSILLHNHMKKLELKSGIDNLDLDKLGLLGRVVKVEEASSGLAWFEGEDAMRFTVADLGKLSEELISDSVVAWNPDEKISGILIYKQ